MEQKSVKTRFDKGLFLVEHVDMLQLISPESRVPLFTNVSTQTDSSSSSKEAQVSLGYSNDCRLPLVTTRLKESIYTKLDPESLDYVHSLENEIRLLKRELYEANKTIDNQRDWIDEKKLFLTEMSKDIIDAIDKLNQPIENHKTPFESNEEFLDLPMLTPKVMLVDKHPSPLERNPSLYGDDACQPVDRSHQLNVGPRSDLGVPMCKKRKKDLFKRCNQIGCEYIEKGSSNNMSKHYAKFHADITYPSDPYHFLDVTLEEYLAQEEKWREQKARRIPGMIKFESI